ncbi:phospholipase D family protein [Pseudomonas sp. 102515]|uniref:phospholipase D family nuclease n=1 Tax=Pseudomonas sp. 102515 TaxID=3071568 RepID=UPI002800A787|nr:phospholipase D family protein [Pseudomonas sp. 102515]MDQ7915842.1 phospholipase D family protein [Pseudomonas sp. 102515]
MGSKLAAIKSLALIAFLATGMPYALADQQPAESKAPVLIDGARRIEVGFSPEGSALALVLRSISAATNSIRLSAYMLTSPDVAKALIEAKQRGVDVAIVADHDGNLEGGAARAGQHALTLLARAGIPTRTVKVYPIHHDKFMVLDGKAVETGSFNYTAAAAKSNSENALVVWNDADLAEQYLRHWQSRWDKGQPFKPSY